ncbi:MAG: hypothetical protein IT431_17855 [Phycisphaerales bacterium]|nr:hypothetical protein [Phycisphaerales bacterium]
MNSKATRILAGLIVACTASGLCAQRSDCKSWSDPEDAVVRRTDPGADGPLNPLATPPEILDARLCAWDAFDADNDPYAGETTDPDGAHLFRLQLTLAGLVNPPGPIGLGGEPFDPFAFGPSPVVGFFDIDVDGNDARTGGELGAAAETRYLANVARFARRPHDALGERIAASRDDLDGDFWTEPQYERSGADFALVLCGCFSPVAVEVTGDGDGMFEADETWLVLGRFFERSQGYRDASAAFGGSAPGLYDPEVELRFEHDSLTDETTITLVWALDQNGAAQLAGDPQQPIDLSVANQTSVVEALQDIIDGADAGGITGPAWELVRRWEGRNATDWLDVTEWEVTGLFGMPYASPEVTGYAWTDTLGEETPADIDGDLDADSSDEASIRNYVYGADGESDDADGRVNGVVVVATKGWDFRLQDTDGDYRVSLADLLPYGPLGDFDGNGTVNTQDFVAFLNAWATGQPGADFNLDQSVDTMDFVAFLNAWAQG